MPLKCNIDAKGKSVRLINGIVTIIIALVLIFIWPMRTGGASAWFITVALLLGGAFMIFEARRLVRDPRDGLENADVIRMGGKLRFSSASAAFHSSQIQRGWDLVVGASMILGGASFALILSAIFTLASMSIMPEAPCPPRWGWPGSDDHIFYPAELCRVFRLSASAKGEDG